MSRTPLHAPYRHTSWRCKIPAAPLQSMGCGRILAKIAEGRLLTSPTCRRLHSTLCRTSGQRVRVAAITTSVKSMPPELTASGSHEWSKHGTCSGKSSPIYVCNSPGMSQERYFSTVLSVFNNYKSECGGRACNLCFSASLSYQGRC